MNDSPSRLLNVSFDTFAISLYYLCTVLLICIHNRILKLIAPNAFTNKSSHHLLKQFNRVINKIGTEEVGPRTTTNYIDLDGIDTGHERA